MLKSHRKHQKSTRGPRGVDEHEPIQETTNAKSKRYKTTKIRQAECHACLGGLTRADMQEKKQPMPNQVVGAM
jgi:hypothetical protein